MAEKRSVKDLERQKQALIDAGAAGVQATKEQADALKRITKELTLQKSLIEEALYTTKEMDETLGSIASTWGKQNKMYKQAEQTLEGVEANANTLLGLTKKTTAENKNNVSSILEAAAGYKKVNSQVIKGVSWHFWFRE